MTIHALGAGAAVEAFLGARRAVFGAVYQHHFKDGVDRTEEVANRAALVETVDLVPYAELIEQYASTYVSLAAAATTSPRTEDLSVIVKGLAHLDVVELRWRHAPGDPGRGMLIAPTHPLRLLWHLRHTQACAKAVQVWEDGSGRAPDWQGLMEQLREELLPINLPMVLFDRRGRGYVEHTPLTRFWPLYLPDRAEGDTPLDAVATRDRVSQHLGIRDRTVAVNTVDTRDVAARLFEYLACLARHRSSPLFYRTR